MSVALAKASFGRHFTGGTGGGGAGSVTVAGPLAVDVQASEIEVETTPAEITVEVFPPSIVAGS